MNITARLILPVYLANCRYNNALLSTNRICKITITIALPTYTTYTTHLPVRPIINTLIHVQIDSSREWKFFSPPPTDTSHRLPDRSFRKSSELIIIFLFKFLESSRLDQPWPRIPNAYYYISGYDSARPESRESSSSFHQPNVNASDYLFHANLCVLQLNDKQRYYGGPSGIRIAQRPEVRVSRLILGQRRAASFPAFLSNRRHS